METRSIAVEAVSVSNTYAHAHAIGTHEAGIFTASGPAPGSTEPSRSLLEGPPLGIYRISAYLNIGFVGACLLLLGIAFVFTHEHGWLAAITAIASGAALSAFAWRRATAFEREGGSRSKAATPRLTDTVKDEVSSNSPLRNRARWVY